MSESELRQRRGGTTAASEENDKDEKEPNQEDLLRAFQEKLHTMLAEKAKNEGRGNTPDEINRAVEQDMKRLAEARKGPLPGLKDETKKAKDALAADPYNLALIYELGFEYIKEEKWPEATNVLIRGWKRVGEIQEPSDRFLYLYQLCDASLICNKYKQAYAVMMDMEEPEDQEDLRAYCALQCKVYSSNDQLQKALKAFHKGIESTTKFEEALHVWTQCVFGLRKVGAYEAAKSAIERMATTDKDRQNLKMIESMNDLKETLEKSKKATSPPKILMIASLVVIFGIVVWLMWLLETRSLKSMKMIK